MIELEDLTKKEQDLLAKGIRAIILSNSNVTTAEIHHLKRNFKKFMKSDSVINEQRLKKFIEDKDKPKFWDLKMTDPLKINYVLQVL